MKKIFRTSLAILLISVAVGSTALATPSVNQLKEDKKKAQKELNDKKRGTWGNINPVTKVQPNKKAYDRNYMQI